ncbi:MAG TPA: hypothetical protein VHI99_27160 [Vicinamibacterales bacterium]|jgi:hypothetical protein|nr:hypothetical protein [Vicinamibacterales bacterium]
MRRLVIAAGVMAAALAVPAAARAQNSQIQGFGGLTFGDVTASSAFGGSIAVPLSDNMQIVGEGGRMTNILPSLVGTVVDFTPFDLHVSAWYGQAGVRFIGSSHRAIRPYAEATAGFARLRTGYGGFESSADAIVDAALGVLDTTKPLVGVGSGVIVQGGPVFLDLGYRYSKIFAGNSLQGLLVGGDVSVNQVRIGAGVRF